MAKKRKTTLIKPNMPPSQWRAELKRCVQVGAAIILLSLLGQFGLVPIKFLTGLFPQGAPFSLDSVLAAASFGVREPSSMHGTHDNDNKPAAQITIVEIDDELHQKWGRPCLTPRGEIAKLLETVASKRPRAIVLDVGFGCSTSACCSLDTDTLVTYIATYSHRIPLILIRDLTLSKRAGREEVHMHATPLDAAVSGKGEWISWAHTFYLTDSDGTARQWQESWEACTEAGKTETIPALPVRIAALFGGALIRSELKNNCELAQQSARRHMIVLGSRILGPSEGSRQSSSPRAIPAALLLDQESVESIDDDGYFSLRDRVAIIGASHAHADDSWRTAIGYVPGVELLGHTVRFGNLQLHELNGVGGFIRTSFTTIVTFVLLALTFFFLRPFVAAIVATVIVLTIAIVCSSYFEWLGVFASLERTIWYFAGYQLALGLLKFWKDAQRYERRRKGRAVLADRIRKEDPECQSVK